MSDLPYPCSLAAPLGLPAAGGIPSCLDVRPPPLTPHRGGGLVVEGLQPQSWLCWRGSQAADWKISLF